ncbi:MAG: dimethylargininase [Planctomycetes bacterium]|nr:dimethylargininase [Planctomycetota bacterium]
MTPHAGARPWIALLRSVPATYERCLVRAAPPQAIDVARARAQHAAYAAALAAAGCEVRVLPADDRHPDCCFIEDTAVLLDDLAVLTRPGAASRLGEVDAVAEALAALAPLVRLMSPAALDGGDVLCLGKKLFVGLSQRTNAAGVEQLAQAARARGCEVATVRLAGVLHLKSAVTALDDETLLMAPGLVDPAPFRGCACLETPAGELRAANVLRLPGKGRVLMQAGCGATRALLRAAGYETSEVDISEFVKGDGALTCLSLLLPA